MSDQLEQFAAQRERLRGIAYRITGTPDDADDVVQDAWLRFSTADLGTIRNVDAWLTTVTSRLAIDRLRSAQHRREVYVGPWLSEPSGAFEVSADQVGDSVLLAESLTLGMLAVLERLSPLERAVFVLHEVFALPFAEVAATIDRSESATRQLARRARQHVREERPRFEAVGERAQSLTDLVLTAALKGDIDELKSFLADDVVHVSDGGANRRAARLPVIGPDRVGRFFIGLAKRLVDGHEVHQTWANGQPALYVTQYGEPYLLQVVNWADDKMTASFAVLNPDKLRSFHESWRQANSG